MWMQPIILTGENCILEPLSHSHRDGLIESIQDGMLWKLWYTLIPEPNSMEDEIVRRLTLQSEGSMLPFTIFNKEKNKIIGATTFLNADFKNRRVEIGSTWLSKSVHRTRVNTEAKML